MIPIKSAKEIETKDEYEKRGFDSPDRADDLVMAYYDQMTVRGQIAVRNTTKHRVGSIN